jgi:DNA (cytosine-5)-methyltransferase 1
MMTQGAKMQQALIQRAPFISSQYSGGGQLTPIDGAMPTMPAADVHELVQPGKRLRVEDCYFRMLQPHEIGRAMAFPDAYKVLGNKRERIKQYGNAVTPPAMTTLIMRQVQALTGERHDG